MSKSKSPQQTSSSSNDLNEIIDKFSEVKFNNPINYNNFKLLLDSLENIECLEYIIQKQRDKNFQEKVYILLLFQIIGNSQEQLSREFTKKHIELETNSFAEVAGGDKKSWFNRSSLAHILDLNEVSEANWKNLEEDIRNTCLKLKPIIIKIFNDTKSLIPDSLNIINKSQKINIDPNSSNDNITLLPNLESPLEYKYLYNIYKTISDIESNFSQITEKTFSNSLALQSLLLFTIQIIGNNTKKHLDHNSIDDSLKSILGFIPKRNIIAHTKLLRNLVSYPDFLFKQTKEINLIKSQLEIYFEKLFKNNHIDKELYYSIFPNKKLIDAELKVQKPILDFYISKKMLPKAKKNDDEILNHAIVKNSSIKLRLQDQSNKYILMNQDQLLENLLEAITYKKLEDIDSILAVGIKDINKGIIAKFVDKVKRDNNIFAVYIIDTGHKNLTLAMPYKQGSIKPELMINPLSLAIFCGDIGICKKILKLKPNPNINLISDISEFQPILHNVIDSGDIELAELLLKLGANPDGADDAGFAAIRYSIAICQDKITDLLISYGADIVNPVQVKSDSIIELDTPLTACICKNNKYLKPFLKHTINKGGLKMLNDSIKKGILWILLDAREATITDMLGIFLYYKIDRDLAEFTLNLGHISDYRSNIINKNLYRSILSGNKEEIVEFFKNKNSSDIKTILQSKIKLTTHIHELSEKNQKSFTKYDISNFNGYTPKQLAQAMEYPEIVKIIEDIGREAIMNSLNIRNSKTNISR